MKSIIKSITRYYKIECYSVILLLALIICSCEDDHDSMNFPLAVNSTAITLPPQGGSTYVPIYSTNSWQVSLPDSIDWASLDKKEGEGNGEVLLKYSENLGEERTATLHLTSKDKAIDIVFTQKKEETN
jgi:hypothetical protein